MMKTSTIDKPSSSGLGIEFSDELGTIVSKAVAQNYEIEPSDLIANLSRPNRLRVATGTAVLISDRLFSGTKSQISRFFGYKHLSGAYNTADRVANSTNPDVMYRLALSYEDVAISVLWRERTEIIASVLADKRDDLIQNDVPMNWVYEYLIRKIGNDVEGASPFFNEVFQHRRVKRHFLINSHAELMKLIGVQPILSELPHIKRMC